ncbi:Exosome complex exonuclease RRP4 [Entamoeba marina]
MIQNDEYSSTVHGVVNQINKLVFVKPMKSRYSGDIGDVVIGRITAICNGFWKVDINGKVFATLQLSSVNLPDGIQRRRTDVDKMNIKSFFDVDELICAEIQSLSGNSGAQLHTRNERYGKLKQGVFLTVHPSLIKRSKSHITIFPFGVKFICGMNGYLYVTLDDQTEVSPTSIDRISRVVGCIKMLQNKAMHINAPIVEHLHDITIRLSISTPELLLNSNQELAISTYMEEMS